jgi:predicted SAM-dependent methyltransferase
MNNLTFNEAEYLAANPDVDEAVKQGSFRNGHEHYKIHGEKEGRMLKQSFDETPREVKVFHLIDKKGLGLEIGPSHNPIAPKKKGFNVHILDHATADQLREKYKGHEIHGVKLENIEDVDYVWHGEPFHELIGKTSCYEWIIASHVIEHVPDLISFLQQCDSLLIPSGILSLVIPDKRYCFDYFSPISSTGNALDAYAEMRVRPSHGQIFDHFANASKHNGNIAWSADVHGIPNELGHEFDQAQALYAQSVSSADYIDAHCWRFTPASFRLMMSDLHSLNLINLEIKAEFDTVGCEFYVSLGKKSDCRTKLDRLAALKMRNLENA